MAAELVPFQPLADRSRRQIVVDLIGPREYDSITTYEELAQELGLDPEADRDLIRSTVHVAQRELATIHKRTLAAVRGVGYRIIRPEEHVDMASKLQRKAGRAVVLAKQTVDTVDLTGLSEEGRKIAMAAAAALGYQAEMMRRMDLRQRNVEKVVAAVTEKVDEAITATDEHNARLAALEARIAAMEKPGP